MTIAIQLGSFKTSEVKGLSYIKGHFKRVDAVTEHPLKALSKSVVTVAAFTCLDSGSHKVGVTLRNLSSEAILIEAKTIVARVAAANIVPPKLAPKVIPKTERERGTESVANANSNTQIPLSKEKLDNYFSKLDLSETKDWSEGEEREVKDLITEFGFLFALDDLEFGRISIVKHSIKLTDETPFKKCYRRIPPHQFEEV